MSNNTPQSFLGVPTYGSQRPQPTPPSRIQEPRVPYVPQAAATMTVKTDGYVYLNAEAARSLPATDGTIDLRPPVREGRGDLWHLDCRAGGLYVRRPVGTTGGVRFRAAERVRAMLGCLPGPANFLLEAAGNDLFRLFPQNGNK